MSLAYTTNQLQEFSRGRIVLGLGSQVRRTSSGASARRGRTRRRGCASTCSRCGRSGRRGTTATAARLRGRVLHPHADDAGVRARGPTGSGRPRCSSPRSGPLMTEVAGEVADGVHHPRHLDRALPARGHVPALERGLAKSGTHAGPTWRSTCPGFISVVEDDEQMAKARDAMRRQVGYYASTPAYRPVLELHGWGDLQTELYACSKRGRLGRDGATSSTTRSSTRSPSSPARHPGRRGERPLRRAGRPHHRVVVAQGVVARRRAELRRCDARCSTSAGSPRRASSGSPRCWAQGAPVTVGDRERRADLGDGGGAFAAFVDGECVVDIWTGAAGAGRGVGEGHPGRHHVGDQGPDDAVRPHPRRPGQLDLDAPVVRYWPEFGRPGQGAPRRAPAAQPPVGRHRRARRGRAAGVGRQRLGRHVAIAARRGGGAPAWEPGTRHGYHGMTFGWLVGELVRRMSGTSLGYVLPREVAQPLGVGLRHRHARVGLPIVATVMEFPVQAGKGERAPRASIPTSKSGRSVLAGAHGSLFADEHGTPRFADFMNTPAVLQAEIGAIGATGDRARRWPGRTRRWPTGEELVSRAVDRALRDRTGLRPRRGHARARPGGRSATRSSPRRSSPGIPPSTGPTTSAFGHMGAGGQVGFADPVAGVACGFVRNHLENQAMPLMGACLVDVLYSMPGGRERGRRCTQLNRQLSIPTSRRSSWRRRAGR